MSNRVFGTSENLLYVYILTMTKCDSWSDRKSIESTPFICH